MDCDELVISLLFPPSDYVSGINVYKRILKNKTPVDVVQLKNELFDDDFNHYIGNRIFLDIDCEIDTPFCIFKSVSKAIKLIKNDYKKVYSRSWVATNHFIALEYKLLNPDVFWSAEFSDPVILNISNKPRNNKKFLIDNQEYVDKINKHISDLNEKNMSQFPLIKNGTSLFFLTEYLTYLFANKLIFTNENQRKLMLNQFSKDIQEFVFKKSEIAMHSTLNDEFYQLKPIDLDLNEDCINIAYFGRYYYGERHFESLFYSIESLNHKFKDKLKIHLFIEDVSLIQKLISPLNSKDNFIVKKPLNYFEFLNATTKFDVLIVNDVMTEGVWSVNPYLPSKISDYLGSDCDIWAFYEKGSSLSKLNLKYMSDINDLNSCRNQLIKILDDYGFDDCNCSFNHDYFMKRLTYLNKLYENEFKKSSKLKSENKNLKKINDEILSSNSWRLTRPLRNIKNRK